MNSFDSIFGFDIIYVKLDISTVCSKKVFTSLSSLGLIKGRGQTLYLISDHHPPPPLNFYYYFKSPFLQMIIPSPTDDAEITLDE